MGKALQPPLQPALTHTSVLPVKGKESESLHIYHYGQLVLK